MKKLFTLALAASLAGSTAFAQEAFRHLGLSAEVGTTGVGVNLSFPLVTNHLLLTVGYNFPTYTYSQSADLGPGYVNGKIDGINQMIDRYNNGVNTYNTNAQTLSQYGVTLDPMSTIDSKIQHLSTITANIEAKLNLVNYKAFLEFYPTTKSAFHITVGMMYGNGDWINISGSVDPTTWGTYQQALAAGDQALKTVNAYNNSVPLNNAQIDAANQRIEEHNQIPGVRPIATIPHLTTINESVPVEEAAAIKVNGQTFVLDRNCGGRLDAALRVKKVKPYIGLGFGSSIPTKHRCGFQMEIGAYYQGAPELVSDQENPNYLGNVYSDRTIDNLVETLQHLEWYPQLTFRWTGRLF